MTRIGTYVAYPDDRAAAILGSPAHAGLGLDIAAWCESSRYLLDGRVAVDRIRRIRGWSATRESRLIDAGFWTLDGVEVVLVGYLDFNRTKARVVEISEKRRAVAAAAIRDRDRDRRGQFTPGDEHPEGD